MHDLIEKIAEFVDHHDDVAWRNRAHAFLATVKASEYENQFQEFMSWFTYVDGEFVVCP